MTTKHRVLVVDDDPLNIEIVQELLEGKYELLSASNGEKALPLARETRPDLVLLDIMMPGLSGFEICRRIKADPSLKGTKVILVSAKAMVQERLEGYAAGADDYITKPFDHEEFQAKVRVFLRMKTLEEVDGLKTRILGLLAHETNTPLTSIIFNAEILAGNGPADPKDRADLCRGILDNAWRLHDFLTKGRLLCRFKEGGIRLQRELKDVAALVRKTLEEEEAAAEKAGVKILVSLPPSLHFSVSEKFFRMVLPALLENLLVDAEKGDEIQVTLQASKEGIAIKVEDRGRWSAPTLLGDPFEALDVPDLDHHSRFLGLSLALSKAVVEAHGGTLSLESTPGEKTVFTVRLPGAAAPEV